MVGTPALSTPGPDPPPFLWLMDLSSSIIEHSLQATWGVTALLSVAEFLRDPTNRHMDALLPWASAHGSPARFNLLHAAPTQSPRAAASTPLALLAADYGLKARSASGIRGGNVDDWPCLTDPSDLALLDDHLTRLARQPDLDPAVTELLTAGLSAIDPTTTRPPSGQTLLAIGDPRLPYSIFEPPVRATSDITATLPLRFTGDPRLPPARDYAWTDLLLLGMDPNFASMDPIRGLAPLTTPNPDRTGEQIRWALHSLCQATVAALADSLPRLPRPPRRPAPLPLPPPDPPHNDESHQTPQAVTAAEPTPGPPATDPPPPPPIRPSPPTAPAEAYPAPLHSGLPTLSPWCNTHAPPTYGTLWSSLQCGPHHVALAGYTTSSRPNLRIGSLNVNGLTSQKLTELLWYMRLEDLDLFFLLDTRAPLRAGKFLGRQAREFLGPGSVAQVSPARPGTGSSLGTRQALVGGQILLIAPSWGSALKSSRKDPTGLGVLTETVLGCAGGDILLLGTYFPCPPNPGTTTTATSHKLWDKLQQWLHQHHILENPSQYLVDLISLKTLRHCSRSSPNVSPIAIVAGDFNATWSDHHGPLKALGGWASAASLLSPVAQASSEGPDPLYSYYHGSTPKSLIDHILLSSSCQGQISYTGVGCGAFFGSISDHRPVLLGLRLHNGRPSMSLGKQVRHPPRRGLDLDLNQDAQIQAFGLHTTTLLHDIPQTCSAEEASAHLQTLCVRTADWVHAQGSRAATRSAGRRHYDGWSPPAMALKAQLVALTTIHGHLHGHRGHRPWRTQAQMDQDLPPIIATWERLVRRLSWPTAGEVDHWLGAAGAPPTYWRTASLLAIRRPGFCEVLIQKVKKRLHGRFRLELRRQISAATCAREALREQGKLKRVIASILQKDTDLYALHSLQLEDGILTDAPAIHNMVTEHFTEWYRAPGPPTDWPSLLTDRPTFQALADSKGIPSHLTQSLWEAFTSPLQLLSLQQDLQRALLSPPTLAEFQAAIQHHKGSTAPGATGLTYNMVKGWPTQVTERVHGLLTQSFSGTTPAWLQWGWLCPKPKDPENGITLDGLRPLMLLEVLRKIWVWIIVRKIIRCWETHQALTPSQHGFRRGHGTDSALLVHLNCIEHARRTNTPLFLSSWDIRRAFDSVSKEVMDASWRRLGVPAHTAYWIAHLDDHGPTAVRSPWALEAWRSAGYLGFGATTSATRPCTFIRDRGTPQGDVSSPHAWTAFFDIALRALEATDPATHFRMPSSTSDSALVSDLGYADDLVSLSCTLDGLQHKADLMSAFALLFDLTISAPKLRAVCLGMSPPLPTLIIHGSGWTPTVIPVRSQGSVTILGLTIDLTAAQVTQPQYTRAHLIQAATILGHQRVADTTALVASVSTLAKAAYTAQFVPWAPQDLQAFDVPLNRAFRRLLQLPPSHPNALLYMRLADGGLGLPRLSDQVNLRKWSMLNRLTQRGGVPALAVGGLLTRAAAVSGGQFLTPQQGDFIGPFSTTPVWGSSLGALGPDTALHLTPTHGPSVHPLLRPLTSCLPRLDNFKLLRSLRTLDLSTWADLTTRSPEGTRTWLHFPSLLPDLSLPSFPPVPHPWPGDPATSRPGQFWRLTRGPGDWAWSGIHQLLTYNQTCGELTAQRWVTLPTGPGRLRAITRIGHPLTIAASDFTARCTHRLLVLLARCQLKGTIKAEFPDTPALMDPPRLSWTHSFRPLLVSAPSWSIYTDASWRAVHPIQAQAVFGLQGTHSGRGVLFLSADLPDWCSTILAVRFDIPPTLPSLGGSAQVAELIAIQAGLQLLHELNLCGTVYSDCLGAVKKITRQWPPGHSFLEAGAALVASARTLLSATIHLQWTKGHPERSDTPPAAWTRTQWGIYLADALTKNRDLGSLPFSPIPTIHIHTIPLREILLESTPVDSWQWTGPDCSPPLGNLRATLSHHRVQAYRSNRDTTRGERGAPPLWLDSHQSVGITAWSPRVLPLRKRVQALRTYWDLRWHGENQAVATLSQDPQVSACPICRRFWSQAHVLCECPSTTAARGEGSLDLTLAVNRLPPGPMLDLGRQFHTLLTIPNHPTLMARRWSGQWDQAAIRELQPQIARCTRKQIKTVLGHIGRVTSSTASSCWRHFAAMARDLSPPRDQFPPPLPLVARQLSTLDWDPRLGEDHG